MLAGSLDLVAAEDIVLFAAAALCAAQATYQENGDSGGDDQRQEASARNQPVDKTMHKPTRLGEP